MKLRSPLSCFTLALVISQVFAASTSEVDERLQQLLRRFPAADADHDGRLTIDEFRAYRSKIGGGSDTPSSKREQPEASTPTNGQVRIEISSDNPVPIHPGIYGINCAEMFIFDLVQKPEYLAALGDLQFHSFLFPGGSSFHHPTGNGGFNIREEEIEQSRHGTNHRIYKPGSPDFFLQFTQFMQPMRGHAVFIPNIANGTVEELDWYLQKMHEAHVPVDSVVLGMEVQLGAFRMDTSADYIAKIQPMIELIKTRHPGVRVVGWSTPVGRRSALPESFRQWNKEVAKVPGIDGFAQYGWTEFGGAARHGRSDAGSKSAQQRLEAYDAFVRTFEDREIKAYADDWGADKKMFMLQWGTHADRNTVVEGLHTVDFLFFMTSYNATHDNYFETATWSVPIMSDLTSGKRKGSGSGMTYRKDIALWSGYLYAKPLRHLFNGGQSLLKTSVRGAGKSGAMDLVKALACSGADGKKHLCLLNRGPSVPLQNIAIDGKAVAPDALVHVESVSGESLDTTGGSLRIFTGDKTTASLSLEPYSVTMLSWQ